MYFNIDVPISLHNPIRVCAMAARVCARACACVTSVCACMHACSDVSSGCVMRAGAQVSADASDACESERCGCTDETRRRRKRRRRVGKRESGEAGGRDSSHMPENVNHVQVHEALLAYNPTRRK